MKDIIRISCRSCDRVTNQKILQSHLVTIEDEFDNNEIIHSIELFMIIQCCGCDTVSLCLFERESNAPINLDNVVLDEDEIEEEDTLKAYPNYFKEYDSDTEFLHPDMQYQLPRQLDELYEELKNAFASPTSVLAGIGLRTLVEAVCVNQNIPGNDLKQKIENLHKAGFISNNEVSILDKLRLIGNISAHQIKAINGEYLEYALGIINHVLISIYILPKINNKLDKALNKKPKNKQAPKASGTK